MGNSHFKSDIKAKTGAETISGFTSITATTLGGGSVNVSGAISGSGVTVSGNLDAAAGRIAAGTYIQLGTAGQYIFFGTGTNADSAASVLAVASALCGSPLKGSLFLGAGTTARVFYFTGNKVATSLAFMP